MTDSFWLDRIPLWAVFVLTVAVVVFVIRVGMFFGQRRSRRPDHETEAPVGTIIAASLGLLAFMLAFTFGIAAQIFQTRRQLLLDEVNAIGTTYLRAGLLNEPHSSDMRRLLYEYVDLRVNLAKENLAKKPVRFQDAITRADMLQDQMWAHAVALSDADRSSVIDGLFVNSLNNMIDLQTSRVTAAFYRIPRMIWYAIYIITILSMFMVGYQSGLSSKSNFVIGIIMVLTFSTVLLLIVDLDRSTEGSFMLDQRPMLQLHRKMQASTQVTGCEQILRDLKTSDEVLKEHQTKN